MTTTRTTMAIERRFPRLRSARARILVSMISLLAFSTLLSTLALREILLSRVDTRSEKGLVQEVTEFRGFASDARDPRTGELLGHRLRQIFDAFLARDIPDESEATFTFLDGKPYRSNADLTTSRELLDAVRSLGNVQQVRRGHVASPEGRVRYLAVPVRAGGRVRGAFVVTSAVGQEAAEVTEAVQVAAGVALAVLLLASAIGFAVTGRVLAPLRDLDASARTIGSSGELTRRIEVEGNDEIAELGRTFNAMLDRLEAAFASQREFISDASHELRTPITIIRGHLELLGDDPDERRDTIALVMDELDRMGRFVNDLLTLAKVERPDFLRLQEIDVDELTEELMAKASALAPRRWELATVALGQVRADRQRLTQAMMSLAQNAVEHTTEGARIALGSALQPRELRLWVEDDGPGIAAADRERIFERFTRGASARRSDGAGLGLAIVRAIAEAHGGRVELRSEPGEGSRFTLVLPVIAAPAHRAVVAR
jgi:signal transduction histidine kinase